MKKKIGEILLAICVSYTIVSLLGGFIDSVGFGNFDKFGNDIAKFIWSGIAVVVLYSHIFFEDKPPLLVMAVQYVVALGLVFGTVWLSGFWDTLHPQAYFHAFRSFTVFYIIGAAIFYIAIFTEAYRANLLVQKLREKDKDNEII